MVIFHKGYSTVLHFYTTKCPINAQFSFRPIFYVSETVLHCNLQSLQLNCQNLKLYIFFNIYFMEHKRPNYVHISTLYSRTTFMFICQTGQQWQVLGNAVLYSFIRNSAAVRFCEYVPVEKDCVRKAKPRARGAKPVTLFYWMKSKVYPKCR